MHDTICILTGRQCINQIKVISHQIKDYMEEAEQWYVTSFVGERRQKMEKQHNCFREQKS